MFKKLDRLVLKYYLGPFVATFFICLFILLMQFLWKYVDDLVGKGLEWYVLTELMFYASASLIPLALPLAVLLSSIMTLGALAENNELMSAKAAGIPLYKVLRPLIGFIILVSIGAFFFSNHAIPYANLKFKSLLYDIRQQKPALDILEGVFYGGIDNYSIRIGKKHDDDRSIEDVLIYDHSDQAGNIIVIRANHGEMFTSDDGDWLILRLFEGTRYEEVHQGRRRAENFPHNRMSFQQYQLQFDLSGFQMGRSDESLFKSSYGMLNIRQLEEHIDSSHSKLEKKLRRLKHYTRPYFTYQRDSAFAEREFKEIQVDTLRDFIDVFPTNKQAGVLDRAKAQASSIKSIYGSNIYEISEFRRMMQRYKIEWHRKFTLSFACLLLFLIGAPLGAIIRKGGLGMPAVVSIILFIIYHVMSITGEKFSKQFVATAFEGMWTPIFILFPFGIILVYQANKDAQILNLESYIIAGRKLVKWFKKSKNKVS